MTPFSHQDLMVAVVPEDDESFEVWDCADSECPPSRPCTNRTSPCLTTPSKTEDGAFEPGLYEALKTELDRPIG